MAKVSFTKLGLKLNQEVKTIECNEQIIEVKQYLPIGKKLLLMMDVINNSEDGNYANPVKITVFTALKLIEYYTNINFTEKQKEDYGKLYDILISSGLLKNIMDTIPQSEKIEIKNGIEESVKSFYSYKNSIMGIIDALNQDYDNTAFDLEAVQNLLNNTDLKTLKDIAPLINQA